MTKIITALFTVAFFIFANSNLVAATLHAIIAADTLDRSIGTSVKIDVRRMGVELKNISKHSGLRLKKKVIQGRSLTRRNIEKAVKRLKVKKDDVVIFYYSGHGFRTKKKKSRWPALYLKSRKSIDFSNVVKAIKAKNPRFVIAISDSCNNVIKDKHAPQFRKGSFARTIPSSYKKLFRDYRGHIYASGSVPGEFAMGNNSIGGFFTNQFLENLRSAVKSTNPKWNLIMRASTKQMVFSGGQQNPQHEIKVSKLSSNTTPAITDSNTTTTTTDNNTNNNTTTTVTMNDEQFEEVDINFPDDDENSTTTTTTETDTDLNSQEFNLDDDPCLKILDAATNIAQAAGDILDKGKLSKSSKLYKDVMKHLNTFEQIAREDGDTQMQSKFKNLRNQMRRGKWQQASEGLFDLFGKMDKIINDQCKSME